MYKGHPFANKVLNRIEQDKLLQNHRNNLKLARPSTQFFSTRDNFTTLNPKKKQMQKEAKFTEIQRQNRLLLQKITTIMGKRRDASDSQMNRSLNSGFRKKQSQSIQVQNAKMLRRLQQRKSDYDLDKYKKQWRKTRKMIKSIASYPIVIDNIHNPKRKKQTIHLQDLKIIANNTPQDFEIAKVRLIGTKKFIVTAKFTTAKFVIIGDLRSQKELKVIEIGKQQAMQFIQNRCHGDIHKIFDFLRYDEKQKSLYLVSQQGEEQYINEPQQSQQRIKPRQKMQSSRQKPIFEGMDYNILQKEDLIF